MAIVNSTGFVDAEPASRNDMFMRAPKKAANPVSAPNSSPSPTAISPTVISHANQVSWCPAIRKLTKSRYHS
jgi:hypothetical protein